MESIWRGPSSADSSIIECFHSVVHSSASPLSLLKKAIDRNAHEVLDYVLQPTCTCYDIFRRRVNGMNFTNILDVQVPRWDSDPESYVFQASLYANELARSNKNILPLHDAVLQSKADCVGALLRGGASPALCFRKSTPLHLAIGNAALPHLRPKAQQVALKLLETKPPLDLRDRKGWTVLLGAAASGDSFLLKTLMERGASPRLTDYDLNTALHLAVSRGSVECVVAILSAEKREGINHVQWHFQRANAEDATVIHLAAEYAYAAREDTYLEGSSDEDDEQVWGNDRGMLRVLLSYLRECGDEFALSVLRMVDGGGDTAAMLAHAVGNESGKNAIEEMVQSCGGSTTLEGPTVLVPRAPRRLPTAIFWQRSSLLHAVKIPKSLWEGPEKKERVEVLCGPKGAFRSEELNHEQSPLLLWKTDIGPAELGDLVRVHAVDYIDHLKKMCFALEPGNGKSFSMLDQSDTAVTHESFVAAVDAAGAVIAAVDAVATGEAVNAFCAVRPPGHHAGPFGLVKATNLLDLEAQTDSSPNTAQIEREKQMSHSCSDSHGFCLINSLCVGAAYARSTYRGQGDRPSLARVAIVDFDVHHGNGTEAVVRNLFPNVTREEWSTPSGAVVQLTERSYKPWRGEKDGENVLFISIHAFGEKGDYLFYPGTGGSNRRERVKRAIEAARSDDDQFKEPLIYNCPLDAPTGSMKYRTELIENVLPILRLFGPDIVFMSAGFDGHADDDMNIGMCSITEDDYAFITKSVQEVANECCQGRLISVLEGGYAVHQQITSPFAQSGLSHVRALTRPGKKFSARPLGSDEYLKKMRLRQIAVEAARTDTTQAEAMLLTSLRTKGGIDATFASPPRSEAIDPFETLSTSSPIGRTSSMNASNTNAGLTASTGFKPTEPNEDDLGEGEEDMALPPSNSAPAAGAGRESRALSDVEHDRAAVFDPVAESPALFMPSSPEYGRYKPPQVTLTETSSVVENSEPRSEEGSGGKRKRKRPRVNYVELDRKMRREAAERADSGDVGRDGKEDKEE